MSVAEEYQATNEELVTSREELQSLNEELTVLNGQLQGSLERQRGLANDLQNILQSADLATLFLDEELCIRFFTRESRSIVCVRDGDVGRPLGDLTLLVDDPALLDDAAAVLATGRLIEREIEGQAERCFMRRILPYASNGTADCGVVLTFSDISGLKAAGRVAQEARAYADAVIDTTPLPMVVLDEDMRAVSANRAFHQAYAEGSGGRHDHFEAPNDRLSQLPILRLLLGKLKTITVPVENHELALDTSPLGPRNLLLSANRIHDGPMGNEKILVLIDDVTERTRIKEEVGRAKADADRANANKSRFLAAASHDLRQPLQTLSLLHGLLAAAATELPIRKLVDQVDETLTAMTDMLDSLLDIDQLEAGTVRARPIDLKIDDLLSQLGKEFTVQADAGCLRLRILRSRYGVHSDPRLLGQMLRNLLANALKFTRSGGVLVGCRYAGRWVRIEVWDTGPGIPEEDLGIVFEEFRQLGNPARERGKGQGLGLSIVQRLGGLLDHAVGVRSRIGKGSIFSVTVPISKAELPTNECGPDKPIARPNSLRTNDGSTAVLIVEDDEHVRDLLRLLLEGEGLEVTTAGDGVEAIHIARSVAIGPALMITDLNLPNGPNGLEVVAKLRAALGHCIPAIVLTGDVSTTTTKAIDDAGCVHLAKPVSAHALLKVVHRMRPMAAEVPATLKQKRRSQSFHESPTVFVVDDDPDIRAAMHQFLNTQELSVATFQSGASFLDRYRRGAPGCLLVDARMPDMSGIELLRIFRGRGHTLRAIMMTGFGDVSTAVAAMKAGASDFIEKPIGNEDLLACIDRAFAADRDGAIHAMANEDAARTVANLTSRQRDVLDLVLDGHPSKVIAFKLGISQRTVDNHRSAIMKKTNSKSIPMLIRAVWSVL
jgi:two-component system CheB/CheR fusion protein